MQVEVAQTMNEVWDRHRERGRRTTELRTEESGGGGRDEES